MRVWCRGRYRRRRPDWGHDLYMRGRVLLDGHMMLFCSESPIYLCLQYVDKRSVLTSFLFTCSLADLAVQPTQVTASLDLTFILLSAGEQRCPVRSRIGKPAVSASLLSCTSLTFSAIDLNPASRFKQRCSVSLRLRRIRVLSS